MTSVILYTYDTRPVSLEILGAIRDGDIGIAAAYGVVLTLLSAGGVPAVRASNASRMSRATSPATKTKQFRQLGVLIGLNFVDMMGFAMVLPLLPFYALRLKATPEMVGWIIASFSIAQLVASPLWGRVSDRYGRRPALLIGLMASAIAFLVFGLATSLWVLFLSRIVQGAGGGTTGVAHAYVSDTVAKEDRARALGWLSAATNAGMLDRAGDRITRGASGPRGAGVLRGRALLSQCHRSLAVAAGNADRGGAGGGPCAAEAGVARGVDGAHASDRADRSA